MVHVTTHDWISAVYMGNTINIVEVDFFEKIIKKEVDFFEKGFGLLDLPGLVYLSASFEIR